MLSGERYALVLSDLPYAPLLSSPDKDGRKTAKVGKFNRVLVRNCLENYCYVEIENYKGYIEKKNLWGDLKNRQQ
jgi:SH3-like domain-containing protein